MSTGSSSQSRAKFQSKLDILQEVQSCKGSVLKQQMSHSQWVEQWWSLMVTAKISFSFSTLLTKLVLWLGKGQSTPSILNPGVE